MGGRISYEIATCFLIAAASERVQETEPAGDLLDGSLPPIEVPNAAAQYRAGKNRTAVLEVIVRLLHNVSREVAKTSVTPADVGYKVKDEVSVRAFTQLLFHAKRIVPAGPVFVDHLVNPLQAEVYPGGSITLVDDVHLG